MNYVMCLDNNNQILCWGDVNACEKYIRQLSHVNLNNVIYENYSDCSINSSYYEDYELFNIQNTDLYLTLGEIKMIKDGCQEETRSIKFIEKELEHLSTLNNVYNKDIIEELNYMKNFMRELYDIHARYNMDNVFVNLDVEALHFSYQFERENKGLPTIFIK